MTETIDDLLTEGTFEGADDERLTLEQLRAQVPAGAKTMTMEYYRHGEIHPDPGQPRERAEAWLRTSIAAEGMLKPLEIRPCPTQPVLKPLPDDASEADLAKRARALFVCSCCGRTWIEIAAAGDFMLIDGESRWRSAAGIMDSVPAIVRYDREARGRRLLSQAAANVSRPLSPLEEADLYQEALADDPTLTHGQIAAITGKSRSSVTDRLALLRNEAWVSRLRSGQITVSQAIEVSRYADAHLTDLYAHTRAIEEMESWATDEATDPSDASIAHMELATFKWRLAKAYGVEDPSAPEQPDEPARSASEEYSCGSCGAAMSPLIHYPGFVACTDPECSAFGDHSHAPEVVDETSEAHEPIRVDPVEQQRVIDAVDAKRREASDDVGRDDDTALAEESSDAPVSVERSTPPAVMEPAAPVAKSRHVAGTLFARLATICTERMVTIVVGPGRAEGLLRLTLSQKAFAKGAAAGWGAVQLEASAADLDRGLGEKLADAIAIGEANAAAAEAAAKEQAKHAPAKKPDAPAPKKKSPPAKKSAAKKTTKGAAKKKVRR